MKKILGIILTLIGIVMAVVSLIFKIKGKMSVSIIGGSDGPTSVFVAGIVGSPLVIIGIVAGIAVLAVGIFMVARKK